MFKKLKKVFDKWYVKLGAPILLFAGWHLHHDLIGIVILILGLGTCSVGGFLVWHHYKTEGWKFIDKWTYSKDKYGIVFFKKIREMLKNKKGGD